MIEDYLSQNWDEFAAWIENFVAYLPKVGAPFYYAKTIRSGNYFDIKTAFIAP